jgi:hypothetical protein
MDNARHREWSRRAQAYGLQHSQDEAAVEQNRSLFHATLAQQPHHGVSSCDERELADLTPVEPSQKPER